MKLLGQYQMPISVVIVNRSSEWRSIYMTIIPQLAQSFYREETLNQIIDPILKEYMDTNSMKKFSRIAYLLEDRQGRPSMDVVLQELEKALKLQENADEARVSLTKRKIKEKLDSYMAYTTRNDLYTNLSTKFLSTWAMSIHEIQSEETFLSEIGHRYVCLNLCTW
ncbi:uncharacterized protein [Rutidosis leptorrhynchoides]|uniref:uncharacterized protein isoform X2 n=1 Tax=Rutidosis leptorrhynchoides TaxID=125765 RepID=UPI003A98D2F0